MFATALPRWLGAAALLFDVVALSSIWRSRIHSLKAKVVWTAIVIVIPIIGAIAWFVLGQERPRR